jgi:hypothetical protein
MSNGRSFSGSNSLPFNDGLVAYWAENAPMLLYSYKESMVNYIVVGRHVYHFIILFSLCYACLATSKSLFVKVY